MNTFIYGFLISLASITSIGAQNIFLIKQAILRQHIFWVALIFFLSDALLIGVALLGLGSLISQSQFAILALAIAGAVFLVLLGSFALYHTIKGRDNFDFNTKNKSQSFKKVIFIALAITYLNPQVYLDTILIIGGIGGTLDFTNKLWFFFGAVLCSFLWFFIVGFTTAKFQHFFQKSITWRILDFITAVIMYSIATSLILYSIKLVANF